MTVMCSLIGVKFNLSGVQSEMKPNCVELYLVTSYDSVFYTDLTHLTTLCYSAHFESVDQNYPVLILFTCVELLEGRV